VYIVEVVGEGRRWIGLGSAQANALRAWYPYMRLGGHGDTAYYLVGDDETLEVFRMACEAFGFKIARVKKLDSPPWYIAGIAEELARDSERKSLIRRGLGFLKPVFLGEKSVEEVAGELAGKLGLDFNKLYEALLEAMRKLKKSVLVEVRPIYMDFGTVKRLAIKVGLIPLGEDTYSYTIIFYSSRFTNPRSMYDRLLLKLDISKISGHAELNRALRFTAEWMYGINARKAFSVLKHSKTYHELLAMVKARELAKLVKDVNPNASIDYKVFTVSKGTEEK